ncbi:hypothetical protein A9Q85_03870 [Cycloclasticus sp. 44_32_T64]|nr:hypothetical protein A9Q85_03870 [Cycloclasticus sp. 44_32_T64]
MCLRIKKSLLILTVFSNSVLAENSPISSIQLKDLVVNHSVNTEYPFKDAPYSSRSFTAQDIKEQDINSMQSISSKTPNFNFLDLGMGSLNSVVTVRGLGNTPLYSPPSVIFYIDDIPYSDVFSFASRIHNAKSIDVYRGPQGALFGKNSYGGVVSIKTKKPSNQTKSAMSSEYSSFNSWGVDGYSSGSLIANELFFNIGGAFSQTDGYLYNRFLNKPADEKQRMSGHASLIWIPSKAWDISLTINRDDFNDNTPLISSLASNDPLTIESNQNGVSEHHSNTTAFKVIYQNSAFRFLSATSRRKWQLDDYFVDTDLSPLAITSVEGKQEQIQWNQEFRISGSYSNLDWVVGLFGSIDDNHGKRALKPFGLPDILLDSQVKKSDTAAFTNLSYNVSDRLRIHTGLRLDYAYQQVDRGISITTRYQKKRHSFHISPKISIDYLLSDDFLLYSSTGLAFKPGGFSVLAVNPLMSEFDSETMWASEIGFKLNWAENRIQTNVAFFYYKIDDYQLEKEVTLMDYTIINVAKTTSQGMEIEASAELLPGLKVEGGFGYTHIRFNKFKNSTSKGHSPPFIPEKNLTVAAQYKHQTGYFIRTEWQWSDKIYFDDANSNSFKEDSYSNLSMQLGYHGQQLSVYLFAKNLTNNEYYRSILPTMNAGVPNKPRSLGIKVRVDF